MVEVEGATKEEIRWIRALERLLKACPSKRIGLVTIGDATLTVIDNKVVRENDLDIHDGKAEENGVVLAYILGDVQIHGVSG